MKATWIVLLKEGTTSLKSRFRVVHLASLQFLTADMTAGCENRKACGHHNIAVTDGDFHLNTLLCIQTFWYWSSDSEAQGDSDEFESGDYDIQKASCKGAIYELGPCFIIEL